MSTTTNFIEVNILSYEELITLWNNPAQHLEEVPFGNFQLKLDLCDEVYTGAEQAGYCRIYAAYVDSEYAGYMIVMATEMIHHAGEMQAVTDSFYINKEYRSSGVFSELLAYVETDLRDSGIRFLTIGINPNMPHVDKMQNFVHDKGYIHTELSMTKEL